MSELCQRCGGKKWINLSGSDGGPCPDCGDTIIEPAIDLSLPVKSERPPANNLPQGTQKRMQEPDHRGGKEKPPTPPKKPVGRPKGADKRKEEVNGRSLPSWVTRGPM